MLARDRNDLKLVRSLAHLACALGMLAPSLALSETTYFMRGCWLEGEDLRVAFVAAQGQVRRLRLAPRGVELGGDVKGYTELRNVQELRLQPKLAVVYKSGTTVEFGQLTTQCQERVRRASQRLSVPLRENP